MNKKNNSIFIITMTLTFIITSKILSITKNNII